ncbi:TetR-like C-terminal domain-containing protein [Nocardia abscessus]|uniref:TetR-like C-terminal domain-containing protein n=1 Tax=Nocardia abscessus TaxID=120957 RepID=UPI002456C1B8|nr:TetR-like C-terminal domain-containing protein [Nocardia abscessus]
MSAAAGAPARGNPPPAGAGGARPRPRPPPPADSQADAERLYDRLTGPARQQLMHRLDAGVQQGQLRAGADLDAATDAIIGTLLYRVLARRPPFPHGADGLLDVLLLGLARDH